MMNTENTALQMIAEAARCPDYGPDMVKVLMKKLGMNEKGFALLMNVAPSTVRLWTSGAAQEERKKLRLLRLSGRASGMRITGSLPLPRRTWAHLTGWSAGRRTGSWEYIRNLIKYRDAAHPRSGDFL